LLGDSNSYSIDVLIGFHWPIEQKNDNLNIMFPPLPLIATLLLVKTA
jgi:hypothetical protein